MEGRAEAVEACRQWARVRVELVDDATSRMDEAFVEFDKQMFRLGEAVFTAEGEVTNVERV